MHRVRAVIGSLALVFGAAAGLPEARADFMTKTQTKSVPLQGPSFSTDLAFDKFDSTLGTLQSVVVTLNGSLQGTFNFTYDSGDVATIKSTGARTVSLTAPGLNLSVPLTVVDQESLTSGSVSAQKTATGMASTTFTQPSDLDPFIGTGTLAFTFSAPTGTITNEFLSGHGGTQVSLEAGGLAVTVTYSFTPVPEPASLALLAAGGTALPLLLRARRRRAAGRA